MPSPVIDREQSPGARVPLAGARVLVVEDNTALRELTADVLALEGCVVTEASDTKAMQRALHLGALTRFPEEAFDLIVTDARMPGGSGIDALERLRAKGCHIPAVMVTAFPEDATRRHVSELDAMLLPKPFSLADLRAVADLVLRTHPKTPPTTAWTV